MIDPAAADVLAALQEDATPMPADQAEWLKGYRADVDGFVRFQGERPDIDVRTLSLEGPARSVPVRVYGGDPVASAPTLIYVHGGGFVAGSLDGYDIPLRHLALRSGWRVVAVDYRLAPEHPYPAALQDCTAVLEQVADGALGDAPSALAVAGDSAGGLLAAVLARRARDAGIALSTQIILYPNADLRETPSYPSRSEFDGVLIRVDELYRSLALYVGDANRADPDLSPVLAHDLSGLCAALVVTNEADPLRDEGELYARRLADAGVAVTLERAPGMIHAGLQLAAAVPQGDALITRIAHWLEETALRGTMRRHGNGRT